MRLRNAVPVVTLLLGFVAWPVVAQQPDKPKEWTSELMMKIKPVASVVVSPDGKRVAFTVREAVMTGDKSEYLTHIHIGNVDGSASRQLTRGDKSCDSPQWSPDGATLAFLSTRSSKRNVWVIAPDGGEAEQLTDVKSGVSGFQWSPNGQMIAFTALDAPTPDEEKRGKEKNDAIVVDDNIKLNRLFVIATAKSDGKREPRQLTGGSLCVAGSNVGRGGFDWSPDGKTIAFTHARTPRPDDWPTADISLVDVDKGEVKPLLKTGAAEFSPLFSPDGQTIAFVASDDPPTWGGDIRVFVVAAGGGQPRVLAETFDRFGRYSDLLGWSADGRKIFYAEARGTVTAINALPLEGSPEEIGRVEGVMNGLNLSVKNGMIGFSLEKVNRATEAHVSALSKFEPMPVSRANADLPDLPVGRTEVIRWKSPDGLEVEGLLTYPAGYEKGKKVPLLLVVHGGPMGVFMQNFVGSPSPYPVAAFAAKGYAVLRPNPRGSSGYGKKFRYANYGDWGGGDYKDLMAGVDHVIGLGVANADRMGVMGWSYGGFMTSWTITQTKRFKAASVGAGVTNLMSFTGTADIPGFLPDYFGGEPWDNLEAYKAHSAMFQVKGVTTPTLIQHGEKDERVPLSQGQELYNALKRQGCTVKMVVYPRTPHGIEEPKLLADAMKRNLEWFDQYVLKTK